MPKTSISEIGTDPQDIIEHFNVEGFYLPPEKSGKLTTSYTDEPYSYNIDGEVMHELSGVALYEIPFTLSISEEFSSHISMLQSEAETENKYL